MGDSSLVRWGGIDLGLRGAAIAILAQVEPQRFCLLRLGIFRGAALKGEVRFWAYYGWLQAFLEKAPAPVAIWAEAPFVGQNASSALELGRLLGLTQAALWGKGWPNLQTLPPTSIKKAITGQGRASKAQVASWLRHYLTNADELPMDFDHATDAVSIALAGALLHHSAITRRLTKRAER